MEKIEKTYEIPRDSKGILTIIYIYVTYIYILG